MWRFFLSCLIENVYKSSRSPFCLPFVVFFRFPTLYWQAISTTLPPSLHPIFLLRWCMEDEEEMEDLRMVNLNGRKGTRHHISKKMKNLNEKLQKYKYY